MHGFAGVGNRGIRNIAIRYNFAVKGSEFEAIACQRVLLIGMIFNSEMNSLLCLNIIRILFIVNKGNHTRRIILLSLVFKL